MDKKKALVLINSSAGAGKAADGVWDMITKLTANGYDPVVYPIIPGTDFNAENIIKGHDGFIDLVLCSGGDGTLNHVIQGIMEMKRKPVIGYIPAGSTNDFASSMKIPKNFGQALDIAVCGRPYTYDIGVMNGTYFNYISAFGAFSAVSYDTNRSLKKLFGHTAYVIKSAIDIRRNLKYRRHIRIEADDKIIEGDFAFGAVCNSESVGGYKITGSDSSFDDGKLELLLVKCPEKRGDLRKIIRELKKGKMNGSHVIYHQAKRVRFISKDVIDWTIDGEFGGTCMETDISVIPLAVTIMTSPETEQN